MLFEAALDNKGVTDATPHYVARMNGIHLRRLITDLEISADKPNAIFPPSYVDEIKDQGVRSTLQFDQYGHHNLGAGWGHDPVLDYRIVPFWHNRMTGLWHMQTRETRIWFDGGRLDSAAAYHVKGFGEYGDGYTIRPMRL